MLAASSHPIRVLIADDHEAVRVGVRRLLDSRPDMEVVGVASDGAEAIELTAEREPDVVLMDLEMPVVDGVGAMRRIARHDGDGPSVVVLTAFSDRKHIAEALDSGAVGYLLKDAAPEAVVAAIRSAAAGESPLDGRVARTLLTQQGRPAAAEATLTEREQQVLRLVARGLANKQIARNLGIAERTVKAHLTSAFQRIGAADRTQAALWAARHGL